MAGVVVITDCDHDNVDPERAVLDGHDVELRVLAMPHPRGGGRPGRRRRRAHQPVRADHRRGPGRAAPLPPGGPVRGRGRQRRRGRRPPSAGSGWPTCPTTAATRSPTTPWPSPCPCSAGWSCSTARSATATGTWRRPGRCGASRPSPGGWSAAGPSAPPWPSRAAGLGMRVLGYDLPQVPSEPPIERVGLEELLEAADLVSLHAALTPESHHLIGAGGAGPDAPDRVPGQHRPGRAGRHRRPAGRPRRRGAGRGRPRRPGGRAPRRPRLAGRPPPPGGGHPPRRLVLRGGLPHPQDRGRPRGPAGCSRASRPAPRSTPRRPAHDASPRRSLPPVPTDPGGAGPAAHPAAGPTPSRADSRSWNGWPRCRLWRSCGRPMPARFLEVGRVLYEGGCGRSR